MGFEIVVVALVILANGLFAMSEMAVVTSRKSRLQDWARRGNTRAKLALELAQNPSRFLPAVQIGITLVGIFTGAFGGRTIADRVATYLTTVPWIEPYSDAVALVIVVVAITYFFLVIGELVPKRLALRHPEAISSLVALPSEHLLETLLSRRSCAEFFDRFRLSAIRQTTDAGAAGDRRRNQNFSPAGHRGRSV
jgi:putative hemolysin